MVDLKAIEARIQSQCTVRSHIVEPEKRVQIKKGIIKKCPICEREFYVKPAVLRKGEGQTCSHKCSGVYRRKNGR